MTRVLSRFTRPPRSTNGDETFDRRLYAPMILGSILNPVNSSMIAVTLIPIGRAFGASPSQTAWLISGLYLATAIGQPVVGRLVDTIGPRSVYLVGTAVAGLGGLLGALAPTLGTLVAARVILGFGTCAGYPASMYLIQSEATRTGRDSPTSVLTVLALASQTVAVVGPTLGGLLVGFGGWRTVFLVNVPLSAACLILGGRFLPRSTTVDEPPGVNRRKALLDGLDAAGIALFTAALVSLLLFLTDPRSATWYLLALAVVTGTGFFRRELCAAAPFFDLHVLGQSPALLATYGRHLLAGLISYTFVYGFTQWMEAAHDLSPSGAGLVLLPMFALAIVVTAITGRHAPVRGKLVVGAVSQVGAAVIILSTTTGSGIWLLVLAGLAVGAPQGLINLGNQNAMYFQADARRIGASAGLLRTFSYLGAIIAASVTGAVFKESVDTTGLHDLGLLMLVAAVAFLALTLADRSLAQIGRPQPDAAALDQVPTDGYPTDRSAP